MTVQTFQGFDPLRDSGDGHAIAVLTYQSRASKQPDSVALHALLRQAKARNRAADVTGMLVLNKDRFFQWLEGPSERLDQIWASIQNDPRHQEIELLGRTETQQRVFSQWDMRFACPDDAFGSVRDHPTPRSRLPIRLIDAAARLAVDQKTDTLQDGIEEVLHMGFGLSSVYSELVEPTAHRLGDLWLEDVCSDASIGGAMSCLQTAVRRVSSSQAPPVITSDDTRRVLIMPPPGEQHMLGIAMVGDLYREASWFVEVEFPSCDEHVAALVRQEWFDVLTFCTSDVFTRFDGVNALAITIRQARENSVNPDLRIIVGGRTFAERPDLASFVGADASYADFSCAVERTVACIEAAETTRTLI